MKRLYTILSLLIFTFSVSAQNNVFVLVDVSLSVSQTDLTNAKQALNEILTGVTPTKAFIAQGNAADLPNFKLAVGDKLSVSKFGSLNTTLAISPNPATIQNLSADVNQVLNASVWTPVDGQTYLTLAKAKIAEYAKNHNISKYKLYIISDNINDNYGKGGKPNYPDEYTRNLAEGYNTSNNPVSEGGYTKLKFSANSLFTLSLSPNVDVSKYNIPGANTQPTTSDTNSTPASITLTSFANGKKDKPVPTGSNSFTVSWTCNCPLNTKYNVMLTEIGGSKYRDLSKKSIPANTVKFTDVPSGQFRITVSAMNVNSATTYVETPSSSYGWLIFLLILIVAGAVGYYFWNKRRQEKIDVFASNKADDIFSKNTGSSTTGNSSNSDYF